MVGFNREFGVENLSVTAADQCFAVPDGVQTDPKIGNRLFGFVRLGREVECRGDLGPTVNRLAHGREGRFRLGRRCDDHAGNGRAGHDGWSGDFDEDVAGVIKERLDSVNIIFGGHHGEP